VAEYSLGQGFWVLVILFGFRGLGFSVQGWVKDSRFGVWGLGSRFRALGSGLQVQSSGFRVQGLGFRA